MFEYTCMLILVTSCFGHTVLSKYAKEGLRNKHLVIEGEYWDPFLMYETDANWTAIEGTYYGVMWDLLMFMQQARNFTFEIVSVANYVWGSCHEVDNCTGMIGMVNRKEADFALGNVQVAYIFLPYNQVGRYTYIFRTFWIHGERHEIYRFHCSHRTGIHYNSGSIGVEV